jgi:putative transposase
MARKRSTDEDVLNFLRRIELGVASSSSVETAGRSAGISDATYYNWRKKYGGMGKSQHQSVSLWQGDFHHRYRSANWGTS